MHNDVTRLVAREESTDKVHATALSVHLLKRSEGLLHACISSIMLFMSWEVIQPKNTVQLTFSHFWPRHFV